ncbi:S41 family peptidase [Pedobacter ginsengiterrae]
MRKTRNISVVLFFILLCSLSQYLKAQNKNEIAQLGILCKTWGLLKYYHPGVSTGKQDWDSVLISALNSLSKSKTNKQLNIEVQKMLTISGKDTEGPYLPQENAAINTRNLDHTWIGDNKELEVKNKLALGFISKHPYRGLNFYAQPNPDNDSTIYTPNEKPYPEMAFPNTNYRLLGLFRFWNVINYFYPYKYAIGRPWDSVLNELIPQIIHATDTVSYHKAIAKMAASINDSHGGLWPQVYDTFTGKYSPSFDFRIIANKAVVVRADSSNPQSLIKTGSVIEAIDGVPLKRKIKAYWDYIPASNNGGKIKSLHYLLLNSKNKTALLSGYQRDRKKFKAIIDLKERDLLKEYKNFFEMESPITYRLLEDSIGYVFFSNINKQNIDSIMQPLMDTKAIIFDMRNYPTNGTGTYTIPQYLLGERKMYSRLTRPNFNLPGTFKYEVANKGTAYSEVGKLNPNFYKGKIILLVDSRTQSAAEWACMTLKTAANVTVIGNQTAGADGNVTRTVLPGGYRINFSGLGIYYPDGSETQRIGIHIDIPVSYTINDVINKTDPLLKTALEFINDKKINSD